jgi:hypothetical protein
VKHPHPLPHAKTLRREVFKGSQIVKQWISDKFGFFVFSFFRFSAIIYNTGKKEKTKNSMLSQVLT